MVRKAGNFLMMWSHIVPKNEIQILILIMIGILVRMGEVFNIHKFDKVKNRLKNRFIGKGEHSFNDPNVKRTDIFC